MDHAEEVLRRMNEKSPDRAFPDGLPEWEHVDVQAPVWAIRHYRKEFAETDPSSPLRDKAAANIPDAKAIGFVFWCDDKPDSGAKARYLSGGHDAKTLLSQRWRQPEEGLTPTITEIKPGVIEVSAPLSPIFQFILLGYLGHAVYL